MDENFLQSLGLGVGNGHALSDQYSTANLAPPATVDPTATAAPQSLDQQYAPAAIPQAPPGIDPAAGNILQQISGQVAPSADPAYNPTPTDAPAHPAAQVINAMNGGGQPAGAPIQPQAPRARHSILDVIGHISDVLARTGGAAPQFQPNLDAATARANALQDRAAAQIKAAADARSQGLKDDSTVASTANTIASTHETGLKNVVAQNAITQRVLTATQAAAKTGEDPGAAFDRNAGLFKSALDPDAVAALRAQVVAHPDNLDNLVTAYGTAATDGKFGLNLTPAINPETGKLGLYQPSSDGAGHFVDGVQAIDPLKIVNTGGAQVAIGSDGSVKKVLPNTQSPDNIANNAEKYTENLRKAAAEAAKGQKPGKGGDAYGEYVTARTAGTNMVKAIDNLLVNSNLKAATGFAMGAVDTPARQAVLAEVAQIKGLATPVAAALLKQQGVARPSQAEILSTRDGLVSDLMLTRQSTDGYIKNATAARTRLLTTISQMDDTARRGGLVNADGTAAPRSAPRVASPVLPRTTTPAAHPGDISSIMRKYGIK